MHKSKVTSSNLAKSSIRGDDIEIALQQETGNSYPNSGDEEYTRTVPFVIRDEPNHEEDKPFMYIEGTPENFYGLSYALINQYQPIDCMQPVQTKLTEYQ